MIRSLNTAVGGIKQFQTSLDAIGNNLANINTVGYKSARVDFSDTLAQVLRAPTSDTSGVQLGSGMQVSAIKNEFAQGAIKQTGVRTDLTVTGNGFFLVKNTATSEVLATRAGDFFEDVNGFLVTNDGYRVQGLNKQAPGYTDAEKTVIGDLQLDVGKYMADVTGASVANGVAQQDTITVTAGDHIGDTFAVTANGQTTAAVASVLNVAQQDTITVTAGNHLGDTFAVTANGQTTAAIASVTAMAQQDTITVTAGDHLGDTFAATVNGVSTDPVASVPAVQQVDTVTVDAGTGVTPLKSYTVTIGTTNYTVTEGTPTAQVDSYKNFAGEDDDLDNFVVTVDGNNVAAVNMAATIETTIDALVTGINDDSTVKLIVTASKSGSGDTAKLLLTAKDGGTAFTSSIAANDGSPGTHTLAAVTKETVGGTGSGAVANVPGDFVTNGTGNSDTLKVRNALVAKINADSSAVVTAANGSITGRLTLTAKVAGTAFTSEATQTDTTVGNAIATNTTTTNKTVATANNETAVALAAKISDITGVTASVATGTNVITITAGTPGTALSGDTTVALANSDGNASDQGYTVDTITANKTVATANNETAVAINTAVNAITGLSSAVVDNVITITADTPGTALTGDTSVALANTDGGDAVAPTVATITDNVDGDALTATNIATVVNGLTGVNASAAGKVVTITAGTPGTAFTGTTSVALANSDGSDAAAPTVAALTANSETSIFTKTGHGFTTGQQVKFTGTVPTASPAITVNTVMYVSTDSNDAANKFTLHNTASDAAAGTNVIEFNATTGEFDLTGGASISSFNVRSDGKINMLLTDGTQYTRGQVMLQNFQNPQALLKQGSNLYSNLISAGPLSEAGGTVASNSKAPGSSGLGQIIAGALELSNVDMAREFSNMITTQRAFQANARMVTTSDEILRDLMALKR